MKKMFIAPILSSILLMGCASANTMNDMGESIEVTDALNHTVEVPVNPERVGVFDYAQIDNMDALGLSDRIEVTASGEMPTYLEKYEEVAVAGTLHEVDLEITLSMQPELAIVASRSSASFDALSEFIPTVDFSLTNHKTFESMAANLNQLAQIFGKEEKAKQLLQDLETRKEELMEAAQASEKTALMVMYNGGSLSAFGPNSRFGHVYDDFGFTPVDENIEVSKHGMEISYEYIVRENPDIIFVLDRSSAIAETDLLEDTVKHFEANPLIQTTKAFQEDAIHYLTADVWYLSNGGVQAYNQMMTDVWSALK